MNSIHLTLQRYRRFHAPSVFTLRPGLTVISGENGAGKSTLGLAMLHALFAAAPKPDPRSDGANDPYHLQLRMRGLNTDLEITAEGGRYNVQIEGRQHVLGRTGTQRAAQAAVSEYLELIDQRAFEKVYFALQNDTAAFVGMQPKDRRELIEEVLQLRTVNLAVELQGTKVREQRDEVLTRLSAAADSASSLHPSALYQASIKAFRQATSVKSKRNALADFRVEFAQAVTAQQAIVAECRRTLDDLEEKLSACVETTKSRLSSVGVAEGACLAFTTAQAEKEEASRELAAAEAVVKTRLQTLETLNRAVDAARAAKSQALQYEAEAERQRDLQRCLDEHLQHKLLASAWTSAQKRRLNLELQLQSYSSLEQDSQTHLVTLAERQSQADAYATDPYVEALVATKSALPHFEKEGQELHQLLAQLTEGHATLPCPTCGAPMTASQQRQRRSEVAERLTQVESEHRCAVNRLAELEDQQRKWNVKRTDALKALEAVKAICGEDQKRLTARTLLEGQLGDVQREAAEALAACHTCGVTLPLDPAEERRLRSEITASNSLLTQLDTARTTFKQLDAHLEAVRVETEHLADARSTRQTYHVAWSTIVYDASAHETAQSALDAARKAHSTAQLDEVTARSATDLATKRWEEARAFEAKLHGHQDGIAQEVLQLTREERLAEHLCGFQGHFFSVNVKAVMRRASQLIAPATGNAIRALELDPDAGLHYWDQFKQRHDAKRLSGGEQALVGLCIRLALAERAQAIIKGSRVKFLILDEVLGSLDEERRKAVQGILGNILEQGAFEYIIMITHLDEVKNNWDAHRLEVRLDRTSGMSSVAVLESTWPT